MSVFCCFSRKRAAVAALLLFPLPAFAAEPLEGAQKPYYMWFWDDSGKMLSSPARGDGGYWGRFAATLAVAGALYANDEEIARKITADKDGRKDEFAKWGERMGNGAYILPALALTYAGGWAAGSDSAMDTAKLAFESAVLSAAAVQVVKLSAHRHRPNDGDGAYQWDGPDFLDNNRDSFPSGHSAGIFSVASVIAGRYGEENPWVAPLVYSLAAITPLSRVYDEKHWASDAFMGSAIGYFTGKALVSYHGGGALSIHPAYSEEGPMLAFTYNFR